MSFELVKSDTDKLMSDVLPYFFFLLLCDPGTSKLFEQNIFIFPNQVCQKKLLFLCHHYL